MRQPDERTEVLSTSACWGLLRDVAIGRIALHGAEDIEVFPVNFVVDGGSVVIRTAAGTKLALLEAGRRATFEADDVDTAARMAWSVVLKGVVQVVDHHAAIIDTFDIEVPTQHVGPKPTLVRLTPGSVSGRRFALRAS